jgi:nitrogen regulatory protein PII
MENFVDDDMLDKVIHVLLEDARTGKIGDGKIFVHPVENAYRIRTGEQGTEAI